jgi:hypothetical protein
MTMCGRRDSSTACFIMSRPPSTTHTRVLFGCPSASNCSAIWIASSLRHQAGHPH